MNNLLTPFIFEALPPRGTAFPENLRAPIIDGYSSYLSRLLNIEKSIAAMSTLSAVIASSHAYLEVKFSNAGSSPTCQIIFISAPPATGKTAAEEKTMKPVKKFQQLQLKDYEERNYQNKAQLAVWKKQRLGIISACPSDINFTLDCEEGPVDFSSEFNSQLEKLLIEHERKKPLPPKVLRLLTEDATDEFMTESLDDFPAISVSSAEAGIVYKSRSLGHLERYNALWSGSPIMVNRKHGSNLMRDKAKACLLLSTQPQMLESFINGRGKDAGKSGFLSRSLIFVLKPRTLNNNINVGIAHGY